MRLLSKTWWAGAALCLAAPATADTLIVSNRGDETVQFFDTQSGQTLATLPAAVGAHEFAVSPDGKTVVGSCYGSGPRHQTPDQRLLVFSVEGKWEPRMIDLGEHVRPNDLRFVESQRVWVTSEVKQCVLEVDPTKGEILRALPFARPGGHMLAWSSQREEAYVPCVPSGEVVVVDTRAPKANSKEGQESATNEAVDPVLATVKVGRGAEGVDLSPDGRWLWVASHASQTISVIDVEKRTVVETLPTDGHPFRVRFTPDGQTVVVAHPGAHQVRWYDANTRKESGRVELPQGLPTCLAIGSKGRMAYAVCGPLKEIAQIDLVEGQVVARFATGPEPDAVAISAHVGAPQTNAELEGSTEPGSDER